ncbi:hypothetical protein BBAD15_g6215 [Beauveria bassiana D1-5]|uniref:Uncharacterized protein n=1 Tax=Beauveria bassiana D1-5 TaxID=1245745 RepID=A0A0A2VKQ2_BEABA|nr:hypothetical protein BBAD15_g6215 [Beauveria bassiana D1-5]
MPFHVKQRLMPTSTMTRGQMPFGICDGGLALSRWGTGRCLEFSESPGRWLLTSIRGHDGDCHARSPVRGRGSGSLALAWATKRCATTSQGSTRVTGIESNPHSGPEIEAQESQHAGAPRRRAGSVNMVLCSVSDEETMLREIYRVLKLGSRFILWEHH